MNIRFYVKRAIKTILGLRFLGRPLRKLSWVGLKSTAKMHRAFSEVYNNIPIVKNGAPADFGPYSDETRDRYLKHLSYICTLFSIRPKISILIPVYKVPEKYLRECLESVALQSYSDWELCIVDDCSQMEHIHKLVNEFSNSHPGKVRFAVHPKNLHISEASNSALNLATGEYVALLDHDDLLYPNALGEMVRHINLFQEPDILYSDECTVDQYGAPLNDPFLKPDWSPLLHASVNYTTHLTLYKKSLLDMVGGFRTGYEGSQDHDLMLRCSELTQRPIIHVPFVLYKWRAHPQSTAYSLSAKPYAATAGERAVKEHFERAGREARVTWEGETGHYRISFQTPAEKPLISVLIPTKNGFDLLSRCLQSIVEKTSWKDYEIIILDNNSTEKKTLELMEKFKVELGERFSIVECDFPFNFAAMNNLGARAARGDYLVLLNNDTEVVTSTWLEELLGICQWPEIGAVGAKLLYPKGHIQHAGILLADRQIAMHAAIGQPEKTKMYIDMCNTIHEVSAVTAACLMIKKEKYFRVGGLDEIWVPNGFGDVDFGIKLRKSGFTNVFTPYAVLMHHESPTRKTNIENFEHFYLQRKYGAELMNDPYFHPAFLRHPHYLKNDFYSLWH